MTNENTIKKSLENLYNFIDKYFDIDIKYFANSDSLDIYEYKWKCYKFKITKEAQKYQNIKFSVYRNIKKKMYPFIQIFDMNNETPYGLTKLEAEILRHHIGLYNNGESEKYTYIIDIFNSDFFNVLRSIFEKLMTPNIQYCILEERNNMIQKNMTEKLKNKILNLDITFLNISNELIKILEKNNINKINDIVKINYEKIKEISKCGYNKNIILFSKNIYNQIHELGLEFENEEIFNNMYQGDSKLEFYEYNNIRNKYPYIKTRFDIFSLYQFEYDRFKILPDCYYSRDNKRKIRFCSSDTMDIIKNIIYSDDIYKKFFIDDNDKKMKKVKKVSEYIKKICK